MKNCLGLISAPNISAMDISAQTFRLLGRFGTCTFRHRGHFDTWTLRHRAISAQGHFGTGDISAHGCFGTLDVSAHGHFGTADISACGHFGAVDVLARGHFGTVDISARGFFDTGLFGTGFFSTFQVRNFLMWTFRHVDISAWWTFRHGDFSALDVSARVFWAHFSLGIFREDISARGFFGTGRFGQYLGYLSKPFCVARHLARLGECTEAQLLCSKTAFSLRIFGLHCT